MQRFTYTVQDMMGLHARNAIQIYEVANGFHSNIRICKNEKTANGKNMLQLMVLEAKRGEIIECCVDGEDETEAEKEMLHCFRTYL